MKIYHLRRLMLAMFCLMVLSACESAPLEAPGPDRGRGNVKDFSIESNLRVALITETELKANKAPELNYGAMDAHFVTIDDITYMVEWNDIEDFKNLKQGEEVTFRADGYIARVEKTGKTYRVIRLHEL